MKNAKTLFAVFGVVALMSCTSEKKYEKQFDAEAFTQDFADEFIEAPLSSPMDEFEVLRGDSVSNKDS